jgi:hypothetical protein
LKVACRRLSALAAHVATIDVMSRAVHVRHSARKSIAKARHRVGRMAIVVRALSLTATTVRTTHHRMAMSVVVKVRRLTVTSGAFDSAS